MTVPLRRPQAPARWDLQGEFARVERQLERGVWTDRMSALVLAGAMSWVWLLLRDGDEWGLLGAPVVLVLFLALSVGSWRLDRWRLQRVGGPAAPSPSSIGQVTTEARGSDIWVAVHAALAAQNSARTGFRDSNTVEATLARPFLDLLITVRVEGDEARGVWSRSGFGHPSHGPCGSSSDIRTTVAPPASPPTGCCARSRARTKWFANRCLPRRPDRSGLRVTQGFVNRCVQPGCVRGGGGRAGPRAGAAPSG